MKQKLDEGLNNFLTKYNPFTRRTFDACGCGRQVQCGKIELFLFFAAPQQYAELQQICSRLNEALRLCAANLIGFKVAMGLLGQCTRTLTLFCLSLVCNIKHRQCPTKHLRLIKNQKIEILNYLLKSN